MKKYRLPESQKELVDQMNRGYRPKFLFFWGHRVSKSGSVTSTCLSQWYPAAFESNGIQYQTAEHFMMVEKARLFGDHEKENKILQSRSPAQAKRLGRMVKNYDDAIWSQRRIESVIQGNISKFSQNAKLGEFLKNTKRHVLVEASPVDRIWGIGMAVGDPGVEKPSQWRGPNLLGFALMRARSIISE